MEDLKNKIYTVRGAQVMLDRDLAELYGVETKQINRAVKRNLERFPQNFMFQLTKNDFQILKSQFAISNSNIFPLKTVKVDSSRSQFTTLDKIEILKCQIGTSSWGGTRKLPYAFTEQGVAMLSAVLESKTAVKTMVSQFVTPRDKTYNNKI